MNNKNFIEWTLRDSNAFLLMITTMLLKRKEEFLIRKISVIMKEFVLQLPEAQLMNLVKLHQKPARLIFHKLSKVSTYYTQMKILDVLNVILKVSDDGGAKVINQESLIVNSYRETVADILHHFESVECNDLVHVSGNHDRLMIQF